MEKIGLIGWIQIAGFGIVFIGLLVSAYAVILAKDSIESSNRIINNTEKTLTTLDKQLDVLEESLKLEHDLAILNVYPSLGKISIKSQCYSLSTEHPFFQFTPIIRDEKNVQTVVPIELHLEFDVYGKSNSSDNYILIKENVTPLNQAYYYNPLDPDTNVHLLMSVFFDIAEKKQYEHIRIETHYTYRPYLPNSGVPLSGVVFEFEPQILTDFKKEHGEWKIDVPESSVCDFFEK